MRSFLFLEGDSSKSFDFDCLSGRSTSDRALDSSFDCSQGLKWSLVRGNFEAFYSQLDGSTSSRSFKTDRLALGLFVSDGLVGDAAGECRVVFEWDERSSTWRIGRFPGAGFDVLLNGSAIKTGLQRPLTYDSCWIEVLDTSLNVRSRFRFKKTPEPPQLAGRICHRVILAGSGLRIGRQSARSPADGKPLLALDREIRSISSNQAEILWDKHARSWILENKHTVPLLVNGTADYDHGRHHLVFGDCLEVPGWSYYTFQFDGQALVHLGDRGAIQARNLEKEVKGKRKILSNINLDLRAGEFVGVLGGSGQGKSTMMNAVCAISPATSGEVWIDGRRLRGASDIANESIGYVPQDDIVHRELTVREALEFAGRLRLTIEEKQLGMAIDRVLRNLELENHQGKQIRVLSGGQRKRVSIATELLTNPRFLFLDEPTSGLDPQTEWDLMGLLHRLRSTRPMGIFCTTHVLQKSHVFDSVVFVHGGRIIFKGPPVDAARYFMVDRPFDKEGETGVEDGKLRVPEDDSRNLTSDSALGDTRSDVTDERLLNSLPLVYGRIEGAFRKLARPRADGTLATGEQIVGEMEQVYLDSPYRQPLDSLETGKQVGKDPAGGRGNSRPRRPGGGKILKVLLARQWRILKAEPLNIVFLLAQALVIGFLVGWVSDNLVFQMFIAVIATLWFGCSNAAQQIVGELPIFRRERLAGVGLNVYLIGKFVFLTTVTSVQALILLVTVFVSHHLFHPEHLPLYENADRNQNRKAFTEVFFSNRPEFMIPGVAAPPIPSFTAGSERSEDPIAGFEVVFQAGLSSMPAGPVAYFENPTGLKAYDAQFQVLEWMAWFFRIRQNLVDELGAKKVEITPEKPFVPSPRRHWWAFVSFLLAIRIGSLLVAGITGVALGLAVSALVQSPTQAVMWVPLILIPQILFGGFVVTSPEMNAPVRRFSEALPSFNLQRLQDVTNVYGRKAPRITNKTKIPAFFSAPPYDEETVRWVSRTGSQMVIYDKISEVSKSWQNLVVLPGMIGQRAKEGEVDSVKIRRDVIFPEGVGFKFSGGAARSVLILSTWVVLLYLLSLEGLRRKQVQ